MYNFFTLLHFDRHVLLFEEAFPNIISNPLSFLPSLKVYKKPCN